MPYLILAIALSLLPVFTWWGERHYQAELRPELHRQAMDVLANPAYRGVSLNLRYFDLTLLGQVSDLQTRERLARAMDDLPGLRLQPSDNRVRIPAELELRRTEDRLTLKGLVNASQTMDPATLFGSTPEPPVAEAVRSEHATALALLESPQLHALTQAFFAAPGDRAMRLSADQLDLTGPATSDLRSQWIDLAAQLDGETRITGELEDYPSIYHFPDYRPQSVLPAEMDAQWLNYKLKHEAVLFDSGQAQIPENEQPKIARLLELLDAAGPEARFILGGHADALGDAAANQALSLQRANKVRDTLIGLGLDGQRLQTVSFGATRPLGDQDNPEARRQSRRVEILLK